MTLTGKAKPGSESAALRDTAGNPAAIFDFRRLQQVPEDYLRSIGDLHAAFLRSLSPTLAILLRCSVEAQVTEVMDGNFGQILDSLESPACVVFFAAPVGDIPCALQIPSDLVSTVLDFLMGGDGRSASSLNRELTGVEKDLLETVFSVISEALNEAWKPFTKANFETFSIRTNPRTADLVGRSESMVVVSMKMTVGEAEGLLRLAVPASLAKLVRQASTALRAVQPAQSLEASEAIRVRLGNELLLDVDFELRDSAMRLADLIGLRAGTVLDLGVPCDGTVTITVNGVPKFRGVLTQSDAKMAVTVALRNPAELKP